MHGIRTGDKGLGRDGRPVGAYEPGSDIAARVTILAEGTQGHLTGAAIDRFGLAGAQPQIWALGVKEIWKVAKPLGHIVHTMGWPLRKRAKYGEFGGSFIYPMGDDMVSLGFVAGLEARDVEFSVHDVLQELKTHKLVRKILAGGERIAWGAKTITEGGYHALPKRFHAPGLLLAGEGAGLVNVPTLKGIHYAIESGIMAAEAAFRSLQRGESPTRHGVFDSYDDELRSSYVVKDLHEVRNMRQAFDKGFLRRAARARRVMTVTKGKLPPWDLHSEANAAHSLIRTGRAARYPKPDGKLTFDKLSSVFLSGNRTRDDQPNHIRVQRQRPQGPRRGLGEHVPGARLRDRRRGGRRPRPRRGEPVQLRPVRRDLREGRPPHPARGRLRPRVHADLAGGAASPGLGHRDPLLDRRVAVEEEVRPGRRIRVVQRLDRELAEEALGRLRVVGRLERLPVRLRLHVP